MFSQKSSVILVLSTLAIFALIVIQLNWLQHSRNLIEEQFDQKVTMALCSAIESLNEAPKPYTLSPLPPNPIPNPNPIPYTSYPIAPSPPSVLFPTCGKTCILPNYNPSQLEMAINLALNRYEIDLDFQYDVVPAANDLALPSTYRALMTGLAADEHTLRLQFSGKEAYVIQKMGLMAAASILILLLVCALFLFNLYQLVQQRRLNAWNVAYFNNMAHEFRTPLTNIQLALGVWKKREPTLKNNRFMDVIRSESAHLQQQVERILDLASLEQDHSFLQPQNLELGSFLQTIVEENQLAVQESGGQISLIPYTSSLIPHSLDPHHLRNAFGNLIDNAIKYSVGPPQIEIRYAANQEETEITFRDFGPGIAGCESDSLFESFRRGSSSHSSKGFGLGLNYVREVIEQHGGSIRLESPVGGGCTFHIHLPLNRTTNV